MWKKRMRRFKAEEEAWIGSQKKKGNYKQSTKLKNAIL